MLKLGVPHMEADHEADGLRFWDGDPTVRLLEFDRERNALLLERCEPGTRCASCPSRSRTSCWPACCGGCGACRTSRTRSGRWPR